MRSVIAPASSGMPLVATRLTWLPAHADELCRLSTHRRILWVASDRQGQPLARAGHFTALPDSVHVNDALKDYESGPGAGRDGAAVRWQLWDLGMMAASG